MNWYYTENNQQRGPVTEGEFEQLVREGKITPDTLVWREGMAQWQVYREIAPATSSLVPPLLDDNTTSASPERDGPPWENRASLGLFNVILETIKGVLFEPAATFAHMKREGGLAAPLQYGLLAGSVGAYAGVVYNLISNQLQTQVIKTSDLSNANMPFQLGGGGFHLGAAGLVFALLLALFLVPLALAIVSFIHAAILHLCLMLLGGANQPFETTYRVVCYSFGSTAVFQLIPICGSMIGGVWNIVVTSIGIAKAHEISTGKAVLAVLLPLICCCGLMIVILTLIFGTAFANGFHH